MSDELRPDNDVRLIVDLKAAFESYAAAAAEFDLTAGKPGQLIHAMTGLAAEAGEVLGKFCKIIRDKNGQVDNDDRLAIAKELGDVLWYIAAVARAINVDFHAIPLLNIEKLALRRKSGTLQGSGDNR